VSSGLDWIKQLFQRTVKTAEEVAEGGEPDATPASGSGFDDDPDRETSTNAQVEGAADQPWSGNN
jgi:hypothetical protein